MYLKDLKKGNKAKIIALTVGGLAYKRRLLAMGLLPGTSISILRIAPLGDPIEISLRGYALTLRKQEAELIQVEYEA